MRTSYIAIFKILVAAAWLTGSGGCTYQTVAVGPELQGTLTVDGKAARDAEVLVGFSGDHDKPCSGLAASTRTDASGRFYVPARTARFTAKQIKAIPYGSTQNYVCFRHNGQLIIDSMFLVQPSDHRGYVAQCIYPRAPGATGEDAMACWWRARTPNNSFKPKPLRGST